MSFSMYTAVEVSWQGGMWNKSHAFQNVSCLRIVRRVPSTWLESTSELTNPNTVQTVAYLLWIWNAGYLKSLSLLIVGTEGHTVNQSFCSCKETCAAAEAFLQTVATHHPNKNCIGHTVTYEWKQKKCIGHRQIQNHQNTGSRARAEFDARKNRL
jgi:hypothetical protein